MTENTSPTMTNDQSDNINELAAALSKAQASMKSASKDSENPFFKSKYADLSNVWEACREALTSNNLCVIQCPQSDDAGNILLKTTLAHSSGQWISSKFGVKLSKNDPQTIGSAITYFRRYSLSAMTGICPEDDDGEATMNRDNKSKGVDEFTQKLEKIKSIKTLPELKSTYEDMIKIYSKSKYPQQYKAINVVVKFARQEIEKGANQ